MPNTYGARLVYIQVLRLKGTFNRSTGVLRNAQKHISRWEFLKLLAM